MKLTSVCCAALLLLNAGCVKIVIFRTVIKDDGSVERYVKIESRNGRADKADSKDEKDAEGQPRTDRSDGDGPSAFFRNNAPSVDSDLKLPDKKDWELYRHEDHVFEARGTFKSVAAIPLDFRKGHHVTEGEEKSFIEKSKSVKKYKVFRCALFSVHEYTETITDCTSPDEFQKAVEKVIALRPLLYAIVEKTYGNEFDLSDLKTYVDREIVPRVRRLAVVYWDAGKHKGPEREERFKQAGLKLLRELGVALPEDVDDRGAEDASKKWLYEKLSELIKRRNGKPLTSKEVKKQIEGADDNEHKRLTAIAKEIITKRYGSEDAFAAHLEGIGDKLFGAYFEVLSHGFQFDVTTVMPGQVVEANGFIDKNEVSWSFDRGAIFPGYAMRARSVAFTKANDLGGGRAIVTSAKRAVVLAEFLERSGSDDRSRILKALEEAGKERSPEPLRRLAEGNQAIIGLGNVLKKMGLARRK